MINFLLSFIDPKSMTLDALSFKKFIQLVHQKGIIYGCRELYVSYMSRAIVTVKSASHTPIISLVN